MFKIESAQGGIQEIDASNYEVVIRSLMSIMGDDDDFLVTITDTSQDVGSMQIVGDCVVGYEFQYCTSSTGDYIGSKAKNIRLEDMLDAVRLYVSNDESWIKFYEDVEMPWQMSEPELAQLSDEDYRKRALEPKASWRRITDPVEVLKAVKNSPLYIEHCTRILISEDFRLVHVYGALVQDRSGLGELCISGLRDVVPDLVAHLIEPYVNQKILFLSEVDRKYRWDRTGNAKILEDEFTAWARSSPAIDLISLLRRAKIVNKPQEAALVEFFRADNAFSLFEPCEMESRSGFSSILMKVKVRGMHFVLVNDILACCVNMAANRSYVPSLKPHEI